MQNKKTFSYRVATAAIYLFLTILMMSSVLMFAHIIAVAFSSMGPAGANQVSFWPVGFTLTAMKEAFSDNYLLSSLLNSAWRLLLGVSLNTVLIISAAFALSKDSNTFPMRAVYMGLVLFTMMFNAGLVPNYLLIKQLGLFDSIWALVLPTAVPVYLCIILLNFFRQLPKEIEESAFIDGASHFRTLISIYLPLSVPAIATIVLFSTINHWNAWFDGLIYMRRPENYPYITYLRQLINRLNNVQSVEDMERLSRTGQRPMVMSYVLISVLPILCVYPFLQRYVKSGLTLGSVKG